MKKLVGSAAILLGLMAGAPLAQETALADPSAPIPAIQPVVGQCEIVAADPERADAAAGICVTATQSFIAALQGRTPAESDQAIADLVLALAPLSQQDETCDVFDDEIAAAIRLAASASSDPEQATRLTEIAQTIDECEAGSTAAIGGPAIGDAQALSPA